MNYDILPDIHNYYKTYIKHSTHTINVKHYIYYIGMMGHSTI